MPKRRLGVALLLPEPVATEVDGLRRALEDGSLGRIPAHVTLVPPVNVREDRVDEALAVLAAAAAASPVLDLTIGPPATFAPETPVVYLAVSGDVEPLIALRDGTFTDPLARRLTWPFVPHVTIAEEATGARIEAALGAMTGYRSLVTIERVHLLQEGPGRVWAPIADVPFGPPAVVGRGGLPLELTVSIQPDPAARAVAGAVTPFAVTARRDGRVVGAAEGAVAGPVAHLHRLEVPSADRGQGVGLHLLRSVESLAAERGCEVLVAAPHEFLRRHGWVDGRRAVGRATATPATATPATAHGSSPP